MPMGSSAGFTVEMRYLVAMLRGMSSEQSVQPEILPEQGVTKSFVSRQRPLPVNQREPTMVYCKKTISVSLYLRDSDGHWHYSHRSSLTLSIFYLTRQQPLPQGQKHGPGAVRTLKLSDSQELPYFTDG
jgi:hypothetical protein